MNGKGCQTGGAGDAIIAIQLQVRPEKGLNHSRECYSDFLCTDCWLPCYFRAGIKKGSQGLKVGIEREAGRIWRRGGRRE